MYKKQLNEKEAQILSTTEKSETESTGNTTEVNTIPKDDTTKEETLITIDEPDMITHRNDNIDLLLDEMKKSIEAKKDTEMKNVVEKHKESEKATIKLLKEEEENKIIALN